MFSVSSVVIVPFLVVMVTAKHHYSLLTRAETDHRVIRIKFWIRSSGLCFEPSDPISTRSAKQSSFLIISMCFNNVCFRGDRYLQCMQNTTSKNFRFILVLRSGRLGNPSKFSTGSAGHLCSGLVGSRKVTWF